MAKKKKCGGNENESLVDITITFSSVSSATSSKWLVHFFANSKCFLTFVVTIGTLQWGHIKVNWCLIDFNFSWVFFFYLHFSYIWCHRRKILCLFYQFCEACSACCVPFIIYIYIYVFYLMPVFCAHFCGWGLFDDDGDLITRGF